MKARLVRALVAWPLAVTVGVAAGCATPRASQPAAQGGTAPELGVDGIALSTLTPQARFQLAIAASVNDGIYVVQVSGAAQQAGLRTGFTAVDVAGVSIPTDGDVIVAVDRQTVSTPDALRGYIEATKQPGERVDLTILRRGGRMNLSAVLGERTAAPTGRQSDGANQEMLARAVAGWP